MSEPRADGQERATESWPEASERLLVEWHHRVTAARAAHYMLASRLRRRNLWVGVPAVVFSAIVGTSLFASLAQDSQVGRSLGLVIGAVSVVAAVLTGLQTFFRFSERAERHVIAGDWYSAVRRDIELLQAMEPGKRGSPKQGLDRIRKEMSKISQQSPEIGQSLWEKVSGKDLPPD